MSTQIDDLFRLTLADGLPVQSEGRTLRYRTVTLRETTVADERAATRAAERVMMVGGQPKLMVSEADFRYALTMRHIESIACDDLTISGALLDLEILGRLSAHDLGLIENNVFLINMAAELRHGLISQEDFDSLLAGAKTAAVQSAPQPMGQTEELGHALPQPGSGPALLADYARDAAHGAVAGDAR